MRGVIWLVLLFIAAVVAATTLGRNDGLVSIYFNGWRTDLSLNLFVLLVLAACFVLMAAARSVSSLISLPQRALLCGADDSQDAAQTAVAAILAGDTAQEAAFLAHCTGSKDSLAFMLARRSLQRAGFNFSPAWQEAMRDLQQGGRA